MSDKTELLVCAATWMELRAWWPVEENRSPLLEGQSAWSEAITFFVTGVGIPAALVYTFNLLQQLRPTRILNIGIAGAYPNSGLKIGDIVVGTSEVYGDVGFELPEGDGFQSIRTSPFAHAPYDAPLPLSNILYDRPLPLFERAVQQEVNAEGELETDATQPISQPISQPPYAAHTGRGCTVNQCTGTESTGLLREKRFEAQFETMEGATIAQLGQLASIPVVQIRAISNIASTRDMRPDNIRLAIGNLRRYLADKEI